jgi:methylglutaconyl-CoA hydratase
MPDCLVTLEVTDRVATICLDSPANRNALSAQLRTELLSHLHAAIAAEQVRVIVLTHSGPVFCAGMDLKEARESGLTGNEIPHILETIWTSPKPVIARLAGPARAGGMGIAAACDFAIATSDVTFAFTEVRIGVIPALISATVLPRMSPRAASELFLTGESFDAERAVEVGLISRAVSVDQLDAEVDRHVAMLMRGAPGAVAGVKAMLHRTRPASFAVDLAELNDLSMSFFASPEATEGMASFLDKRAPTWMRPAQLS